MLPDATEGTAITHEYVQDEILRITNDTGRTGICQWGGKDRDDGSHLVLRVGRCVTNGPVVVSIADLGENEELRGYQVWDVEAYRVLDPHTCTEIILLNNLLLRGAIRITDAFELFADQLLYGFSIDEVRQTIQEGFAHLK